MNRTNHTNTSIKRASKPKRGGSRPGAGRKPKIDPTPALEKKVQVNLRLKEWIADWLGKQEGTNGGLVEQALIQTYGLQAPTEQEWLARSVTISKKDQKS
jgi:hypothetical protein